MFDANRREDRYIEVASVLGDLHSGKLTVLRTGKPRFSLAAQPDGASLHERTLFLSNVMRRITAIQKQRGVSFRRAYALAKEAYKQEATPQSPPFPPESTMYRYRK